ncbi:MAG: hypothetical protein NXH91_13725 [Phyllobacteriaceae bacterium]|jgi:hypothetical protein|nr:hypothetical protein [Phyllobacteriaceae bacterium]
MADINWLSLIAVVTSLTALALSAYTTYLTFEQKRVRETPYVIPEVYAGPDAFRITLSNYSEVTADVKIVRLIGPAGTIEIAEGVFETPAHIYSFVEQHFFGRFGMVVGGDEELGIDVTFNMPAFLRVRQDKTFLELAGLGKAADHLEGVDALAYANRVRAELQFEVCSCNIYGDSCLIAGTHRAVVQLSSCPLPTPSGNHQMTGSQNNHG